MDNKEATQIKDRRILELETELERKQNQLERVISDSEHWYVCDCGEPRNDADWGECGRCLDNDTVKGKSPLDIPEHFGYK